MKHVFTIAELDRVVKFVNELNALGKKYKIGVCLHGDGIQLQMDGKVLPFALDAYDEWDLSVVVSL